MTLDRLRETIDLVDRQLKELFFKRMETATKIAESKVTTGDKILKPEREVQVIERLVKDVDEDLVPAYTSFIKKIMEISRTHQYRNLLKMGVFFKLDFEEGEPIIKKVCYQGLPSSYSEQATRSMFPDAEAIPVSTFEDVFLAIDQDQTEAGIVPLENTTAGGVYEVYDLLAKYNLYINSSDIIKVEHCLAAKKNVALEDLEVIYSHPQALAQCSEFLKKHSIVAKESSNTAVAAKEIADSVDGKNGALCSKEAATRYGLNILMECVNHNKENATKFVGVSKHLIVAENHDRIAIVFACPHRSGSLASVLGIFGDYGVNLTEIHSRPDGKNSWEYLFYVDFTGNLKDERIKALFYQLNEELPLVKIIGSYKSMQ